MLLLGKSMLSSFSQTVSASVHVGGLGGDRRPGDTSGRASSFIWNARVDDPYIVGTLAVQYDRAGKEYLHPLTTLSGSLILAPVPCAVRVTHDGSSERRHNIVDAFSQDFRP